MVRLSFTTMGTPELDGFEAIVAAKKYGYQGVDMRVHQHKGEILVDSSDEHIQALRDCGADNNIEFPGLLCYNETGTLGEADTWIKMRDSILAHLEIGQKLGSAGIRIFGGNIHKSGDESAYIQEFAQVLRDVFERDDSSLHIVLQNHGNSLTFLQGMALADATGHDRFGMTCSPDHCTIMGDDMNIVYANAAKYSKQTYFADVKMLAGPDVFGQAKDGGRNNTAILPGEGDVPFAKIFKALGGEAFPGWYTFKWEKIWQDHLEEPDIALPYFVKYFNEKIIGSDK